MPGGVTAGGRFNPVLGRPYYFERAQGSRLWDVDGNEFLDYSSSNGASLLGHAHPKLAEAARKAIDLGTLCTQETAYHVELCERLVEIIPSAEFVRLQNTGTEATAAMIRIARAATGRSKVLKFDGHFHGMHDQVLWNCHTPTEHAHDREIPPFSDSDGVPAEVGAMLVIVPFNDADAFIAALNAHGDEMALVMMEPISYNLGCVPADPDFIRLVRDETRRRSILLGFDEVLSGFRMGLTGGEGYLGVEPDISAWAKALAGGWPLSAVTGRAQVLDHLGPVGKTVVSGTYTGHLSAVLASLAALDVMSQPGFYPRLNGVANSLYDGISTLFTRHGVPGHVRGIGARFGLYFGVEGEVHNYADATAFDAGLNRRFLAGCVERGLHFHDFGTKSAPMHYGITAAHTEEDVRDTLGRLDDLFESLGQGA
jgi:glutamate-1-semialdehyde 2,1-aminomutase